MLPSQDPMPQTGDVMQIANVTPRHVMFWRGHQHVKASVDYEKFLRNATIEQIEKTFSIKLTKNNDRSDEGNEFYSVELIVPTPR